MRFLLFFFPLSLSCATPPNTPASSQEIKDAQHIHLQIRLTQSGEANIEEALSRKLVLIQMQEKARHEKEKQ